MVNIISIENDTSELSYTVGSNSVTDITFFEEKNNGTVTYRVIKDGKLLFVNASKWKVKREGTK